MLVTYHRKIVMLEDRLEYIEPFFYQFEYIEHILWSDGISSKYHLEATHFAQVGLGAKKDVELHTAVASFMMVPWRNIPERKNLTISRFS